jgi:protein-tyrosine phosphatase
MASDSPVTRVLFVCLGNICRSPTAHGVFQHVVDAAGEGASISVDSCGTAGWHTGKAPDSRAVAEALRHGYDLSPLRARQLQPDDFEHFDYILAMDSSNLEDLRAASPPGFAGVLRRFLDSPGAPGGDVPDPYYGGEEGFAEVLRLVEVASAALLNELLEGR